MTTPFFLGMLLGIAEILAGGEVEGRVTYRGPVPRDSVADDGGRYRPLMTVNAADRGIQDVIVFIVPEDDEVELPEAKPLADSLAVDQIDHTFRPHVLAITAGQDVIFTNSDDANHNVRAHAANPRNEFNIVTQPYHEHTHRFEAEPAGAPIRLSCDIHPWMHGWIYVFPRAGYAVTDARGAFRIPNVPPGRYTLRVEQPDAGLRATLSIAVPAAQPLEIELTPRDRE